MNIYIETSIDAICGNSVKDTGLIIKLSNNVNFLEKLKTGVPRRNFSRSSICFAACKLD